MVGRFASDRIRGFRTISNWSLYTHPNPALRTKTATAVRPTNISQ
jgi:hypothetical protein